MREIEHMPPRISPLLETRGHEADLPYAPAPWVLKECRETGLVFLVNPPAYEALSETFAYEVTFEKESSARRAAEPLRYAISTGLKHFRARVLKRNKMLRLARQLIEQSASERVHVLDVGCGWGSLLDELHRSLPGLLQRRVVPHGVEISKVLAGISDEKLRKLNGSCIHAPAQEGLLSFAGGSFDVIIMASYLEHEARPLAVLRNSASRLKPGGAIIIKVPNYASVNRKLRGARWCGFRWPDHVNYFTPTTLSLLAAKAGLAVTRMTLLDQNPLSDNMYAILKARA